MQILRTPAEILLEFLKKLGRDRGGRRRRRTRSSRRCTTRSRPTPRWWCRTSGSTSRHTPSWRTTTSPRRSDGQSAEGGQSAARHSRAAACVAPQGAPHEQSRCCGEGGCDSMAEPSPALLTTIRDHRHASPTRTGTIISWLSVPLVAGGRLRGGRALPVQRADHLGRSTSPTCSTARCSCSAPPTRCTRARTSAPTSSGSSSRPARRA